MDWLAKAIGLPSVFYHSNKETLGGGVIQVNRSDIITLSYRCRVSATVMIVFTNVCLSVCLSVCLYVHVLIFTRATLR